MIPRIRVTSHQGDWVASCPECAWRYGSKSLPRAHGEARDHSCTPMLGPRPTSPDATVVGDGSAYAIRAEASRYAWHRLEVWA